MIRVTGPLLEAIFSLNDATSALLMDKIVRHRSAVWHFADTFSEMNEPKQDPFSLSLALIFMLETSGCAAICHLFLASPSVVACVECKAKTYPVVVSPEWSIYHCLTKQKDTSRSKFWRKRLDLEARPKELIYPWSWSVVTLHNYLAKKRSISGWMIENEYHASRQHEQRQDHCYSRVKLHQSFLCNAFVWFCQFWQEQ